MRNNKNIPPMKLAAFIFAVFVVSLYLIANESERIENSIRISDLSQELDNARSELSKEISAVTQHFNDHVHIYNGPPKNKYFTLTYPDSQ